MEYSTLNAVPRTVLGKKVKTLRREGILPANVYGKGMDSKAIQLDNREFVRLVRAAGIRTLFKLEVADESSVRYVFVKAMQRQGGMGIPTHVDFYQLELDKPIESSIAIRLTGTAPAVRDLAGTLNVQLERLAMKALPLEIPDHIEVDLGSLVSFEATLTVADLPAQDGVEVLTSPETVIARVDPPRLRLDDVEEE